MNKSVGLAGLHGFIVMEQKDSIKIIVKGQMLEIDGDHDDGVYADKGKRRCNSGSG